MKKVLIPVDRFRNGGKNAMKKILFILLAVAIILPLAGCSIFRPKSYPFTQSTDNIESIEIVDAQNRVDYTVLKALSDTEKTNFLSAFQALQFQRYLGDPGGARGKCVRIAYADGTYELVSRWTAEYVSDSSQSYHFIGCVDDGLDKLIARYLE